MNLHIPIIFLILIAHKSAFLAVTPPPIIQKEFNPKELEKQAFGFAFNTLGKGARVTFVFHKSMAYKKGLRVGDLLLSINGTSTRGKAYGEIVKLMQTKEIKIEHKSPKGKPNSLTLSLEPMGNFTRTTKDGRIVGDRDRTWSIFGPDSGEAIQDFKVTGPNGKEIQFSKIKAKAKLVIFWRTKCMPCNGIYPQLINLYKTKKAKGFEIVNISLDTNATHAKKYVENFKLIWYHHYGENGVNSKINDFWQAQLPGMALVGKDNKIISTYFSKRELFAFIKKEFE